MMETLTDIGASGISGGLAGGIIFGLMTFVSRLLPRNGRAAFDPKFCAKQGERIAHLETQITVSLESIDRRLEAIERKQA